jgi:PAS domain-containing protein
MFGLVSSGLVGLGTRLPLHWIAKHRQRLAWIAYAPVLIAAASLAVAAYFLERNADYSNRSDLRLKTSAALSVRAGMLHRRIQFEIASIGAMQRHIAENPELRSEVFMRQANAMMEDNPDLLSISATDIANQSLSFARPGIEPQMPGKKTLRPDAPADYMLGTPPGFEVANFGPLLLAGPGTYGIRVTMPVFTRRAGEVVHWGSVTGIIDAAKFFRKAGISYSDGRYFLAIRLDDGNDGSLKPFFRSDQVRTVFAARPEQASLNVFSDTWRIAALPAGGWERPLMDVWTMRGIMLAIGAMILLPFLRSARLRRLNDIGQEALQQRELVLQRLTKRLDLALESYQCGIWEAAHNVEDTYWDERMQELHGVRGRLDWATRRNWLSLVHPDDKKRAADALNTAAAELGRLSLTARIIRPDGEIRSIRYVAQYHEGQDGRFRLFGIAVDVTDYVARAEELRLAKLEAEQKNRELEKALEQLSGREHELRMTSQRLTLAMEAYGCGIWESNLDDQTHYWDPRMRELYGVDPSDGRTNREIWLSRVHPEDRERALAGRLAAIARGGRYSASYRIMPTPDTIRYLRVVGFLAEQPGEARRFIGLAVDTTEDVLLQEALREAKRESEDKNRELEAALARLSAREADLQDISQRMQLATQTYGCGVWESDPAGGISFWDARMHEIFDVPYVDGRVDYAAFQQRVHPEDLERVGADAAKAIESGDRFSTYYRIISQSGEIRHVHAVGQMHKPANSAPKFIGISVDVTEERQRNEALVAAKNDAEAKRAELEAMHAKLQFNATHDPLTGLQNRRALDAELERLATVSSRSMTRWAMPQAMPCSCTRQMSWCAIRARAILWRASGATSSWFSFATVPTIGISRRSRNGSSTA